MLISKLTNFFPRNPHFLIFLFICFFALIIVSLWFAEGFILGTAESKIPFYRLESFQKITENTWFDINLGNTSNLILAAGPTWWLLSQLQKIGVPGFVIQALVFWFLLVLSGTGIYTLTAFFFPKLDKKFLIFCVLFYWFNPLALVNVWNRFLYNYMVFYAILPFLTYLYIKGLETKKYFFALIIPLFLAFFSYALTAYVFNLLIFFLLTFTWLFFVITQFKKDFILFTLRYNLIILIGFFITNAWWLLPTWEFLNSQSIVKELPLFVTAEGNLYTLNVISEKLGRLIDITRLIHIAFYQNEGPAWVSRYTLFPLNILLSLSSVIIFLGLLSLRKEKWGLYLAVLFLIGIFLAKGNAPPFGEIFQAFFQRFSVVQIFRDPFEKFAFIIMLVTAPLFSFGLHVLTAKLKGRTKGLSWLLGFIIIVILGFPFLSGLVFTSKSPPNDIYPIGYKVKVPPYYKEADQWLSSQGRNFRFISFPLGDEGITYKWEKGYQGVEPSEILFSTPGITFNTSVPYYSQVVDQLEKLLFQATDFSKVANVLNAKYLLLHSDVDIGERRLRDPNVIEALLQGKEKKGEFKKVAQFGKLTFWENLKWVDRTVYASNSFVLSSNPSITDILLKQVNPDDVLILKNPDKQSILKQGMEIIHPQEVNDPNENHQIFNQQKKYQFSLSSDEDYEFLLDNLNISEKEATLAAQLKVFIDNKPITISSQIKSDRRISLGEINLGTGLHEIFIERPTSQNLISETDNLVINSIPGQNQAVFEISNFDPYSRYQIEFDYLVKSGQEFVFMFQQSNDLIRNGNVVPQYPYFNVLNQGNTITFTHASRIYGPSRAEKASLLFWVNPSKYSEIALKNVSVQRLIEPKPILIRKASLNDIPLPQINYVKLNSTKYIVQVKGASSSFALVLSQLFNSEWEARFSDGIKISSHFLANAYANGWFVDKAGDYDITLEFAPEKIFKIGKIISVVSFVGGLIYIVSVLWRKSN